jgi:hypothetical protein
MKMFKVLLLVALLVPASANSFWSFGGSKPTKFKLSVCQRCFELLPDDFRIDTDIQRRLDAKLPVEQIESQLVIMQHEYDARDFYKTGEAPEEGESSSFEEFKKLFLCLLEEDSDFAVAVVDRLVSGDTDTNSPMQAALHEYTKRNQS